MVKLRVMEILSDRGMTKYRLHQKMQAECGISYGNFKSMIENKTSSIKYRNIELLSKILECNIGDLFEIVSDPESLENN